MSIFDLQYTRSTVLPKKSPQSSQCRKQESTERFIKKRFSTATVPPSSSMIAQIMSHQVSTLPGSRQISIVDSAIESIAILRVTGLRTPRLQSFLCRRHARPPPPSYTRPSNSASCFETLPISTTVSGGSTTTATITGAMAPRCARVGALHRARVTPPPVLLSMVLPLPISLAAQPASLRARAAAAAGAEGVLQGVVFGEV